MKRFARVMAGSAIACTGLTAAAPDPAYVKQVEAFRAKHETDYRKEYVSLAGLHFLKPGANRVGSAATNDVVVLGGSVPATVGTFTLAGADVRFEPQAGVQVTLKDQPVTQAIALKADADKGGPDELEVGGGVSVWIHNSGDRRAIRVRDENGAVARAFEGFHWFPVNPKYRVVGRFIRDAAPREVAIPTLTGDFANYTTEGLVELTLQGKTFRVRPMTTRPKRFFLIFKDASSGSETYAAARFLYADLNDDGTTVLDFNEAYNPPCAFNPYTTCPLPPAENRMMRVKILAGEKAYPHPPAHPQG